MNNARYLDEKYRSVLFYRGNKRSKKNAEMFTQLAISMQEKGWPVIDYNLNDFAIIMKFPIIDDKVINPLYAHEIETGMIAPKQIPGVNMFYQMWPRRWLIDDTLDMDYNCILKKIYIATVIDIDGDWEAPANDISRKSIDYIEDYVMSNIAELQDFVNRYMINYVPYISDQAESLKNRGGEYRPLNIYISNRV